jgi:acyl carrier protein
MITPDKEKIAEELADYIKALTSTDQQITDSTKLKDLSIDSISLVKIFVYIERNFNISLINAGLGKKDVETFGSLVQHIFTNS